MKRLDKLTKKQEAMMRPWAEKWIAIGLSTGKSDKPKTEEAIRKCYKFASLDDSIPIVWTTSPISGAFSASISMNLLTVSASVHAAVSDAVNVAVRDAVSDAVHDAVRASVRDAVSDAVHDTVSNKKIEWHNWIGGTMWCSWDAHISFLIDVCNLELPEELNKRFSAIRTVTENCSYWLPNKSFCIVCAKPSRLITVNNKLHCLDGKAIEFSDGWGIYALEGEVFNTIEQMHAELLSICLEAK